MKAGSDRSRLEVGRGLGLAEARAKALEMRAKVWDGEVPAQPRREAIAAAKAARTLGRIIDDYAANEGTKKKTWHEQNARMRSVFASLLVKNGLDLTEADFLLAADQHPSPASARCALAYVRPVLKWAARRKLMQKGLASEIQPGQTKKRARRLAPDEMHRVLSELGSHPQDRGARFLLWTLSRRDEMARADWSDIDLDFGEWRIPAGHRKNVKGCELSDLIVPLPRQAISMLREMSKEQQTGLVFRNSLGRMFTNPDWSRWQKSVFERSQTEGWHRHDLRRTGATFAGQLGTPPHVIEVMLGHAEPHSELAGIYNHSRYTPEHRAALQALADIYERIQRGEDNVLNNRTRA